MATFTERLALLITADGSGAVRELRKVADATVAESARMETGIAKASGSLTKFGVGAVAAGAVVLAGVGKAVNAAQSLTDSFEKANAVLGKSDALEKWANDAVTRIGETRSEALDLAATLGNVGKAAGIAPGAQLTGVATNLATRVADIAELNKKPVADVEAAVISGLNGRGRALKALGINLDANLVKEEAYRSGIAKQGTEITKAQGYLAAYNLILRDSAKAQGEAADTTDPGVALKIARAKLVTAEEDFGKSALPVFTTIINDGAKVVGVFTGINNVTHGAAGEFVAFGGIASVAIGVASTAAGQLLRPIRAVAAARAASAAAAATETTALAAVTAAETTATTTTSALAAAEVARADALAGVASAESALAAKQAVAVPSALELAAAEQAVATAEGEAALAAGVLADAQATAATAATGLTDAEAAAATATAATASGFGAMLASAGPLIVALAAVAEGIALIKYNSDEYSKATKPLLPAEHTVALAFDPKNPAALTQETGTTAIKLAQLKFGQDNPTGLDKLNPLYKDGTANARLYAESVKELDAQFAAIPTSGARAYLEGLKKTLEGAGYSAAQVHTILDPLYKDLSNRERVDRATASLNGFNTALGDTSGAAAAGAAGLDQYGHKIDETKTKWEQFADSQHQLVDPALNLLKASDAKDQAASSLNDANKALADALAGRSDGITSAKAVLDQANAALRQAAADTGPASDAALHAFEALQSAEDKLLGLQEAKAKQTYDDKNRDKLIAEGKDVGPAGFDKNFNPEIVIAAAEVNSAQAAKDKIASGNSDQIVAAKQAVTKAQSDYNAEVAKLPDIVAKARRDVDSAEADWWTATLNLKTAQIQLGTEIQKNPGYIDQIGQALTDLGAPSTVVDDLIGKFRALQGAAQLAAGAVNSATSSNPAAAKVSGNTRYGSGINTDEAPGPIQTRVIGTGARTGTTGAGLAIPVSSPAAGYNPIAAPEYATGQHRTVGASAGFFGAIFDPGRVAAAAGGSSQPQYTAAQVQTIINYQNAEITADLAGNLQDAADKVRAFSPAQYVAYRKFVAQPLPGFADGGFTQAASSNPAAVQQMPAAGYHSALNAVTAFEPSPYGEHLIPQDPTKRPQAIRAWEAAGRGIGALPAFADGGFTRMNAPGRPSTSSHHSDGSIVAELRALRRQGGMRGIHIQAGLSKSESEQARNVALAAREGAWLAGEDV